MLWDDQISVGAKGLRRNFEAPPVLALRATVEVAGQAIKRAKPTDITAVRTVDGKKACFLQELKGQGKPTIICASEGRYRLLVYAHGEVPLAAWAGEIEARGEGPMPVKATVTEWKYYSETHDGRVRLLDEKPEPGEHR
jgi:hypothetical protein